MGFEKIRSLMLNRKIFALAILWGVLLVSCGKEMCIAGYGEYCQKLGKTSGALSGGGLLRCDPTKVKDYVSGSTVTVPAIGGVPPYRFSPPTPNTYNVTIPSPNVGSFTAPTVSRADSISIQFTDSAAPQNATGVCSFNILPPGTVIPTTTIR